MDIGLQKIVAENIGTIISSCVSFLIFIGSIIIWLILRIDKKRESNNKEREDNNKERFKAGEKRFEKIEKGQEKIIREIKEGQKEDSEAREEIKNVLSKISDRLLILETDHGNNHNRRDGDKK